MNATATALCLGVLLAIVYSSLAEDKNQTKLKISVYYETKCPDCTSFLKDQLFPIYNKIPEYLTLELVPYGNSWTMKYPDGTTDIICQHGLGECGGNIAESCALALLPPKVAYSFIYCTLVQGGDSPNKAGVYCAERLNVTRVLLPCWTTNVGFKLHLENGKKTDALVPPHEWTPWVTFNGVWDRMDADMIQQDLLMVICKYLNGTPSTCNDANEVEFRRKRPLHTYW